MVQGANELERKDANDLAELRALKAAYLTGRPEAAAAILGFLMCWETDERKPIFFTRLVPFIRECALFRAAEQAANGMKTVDAERSTKILEAVKTLRSLFNGDTAELHRRMPLGLHN